MTAWRQVEVRVVVLRGRAGEDRIIGALKDIPQGRGISSLQPAQISSLTGCTRSTGQAIIEKPSHELLRLSSSWFRNLDEIERHIAGRTFFSSTGAILRNLARENDVPIHLPRRFVHPVCGSVRVFVVTDLYNLQRTLGSSARSTANLDSRGIFHRHRRRAL